MAQETPINNQLKNVFDEKSTAAIRNANTISPSPETIHTKQNNSESTDPNELRKLRNYISEQEQRITILIESQNKLIGEFNKLESEVKELRRKVTQQAESQHTNKPTVKEEKVKESEEKLTVSTEQQQTGAGEGLKSEEYSVEKFFYFGSK